MINTLSGARRGRRFALLSACVAFAGLVLAALLERDVLLEKYYIFRLDSLDEAVRLNALKWISEARSLAALPHLLDLLEAEKREKAAEWVGTRDAQGGALTYVYSFTPISHAIYRIGQSAKPTLERAINDRDRRLAQELDEGPEIQAPVPVRESSHILYVIRDALNFSDCRVELAGY